MGYRRVLTELGATLNVGDKLLPQKIGDLTRAAEDLESRVQRLSGQLANTLAGDVLAQAEVVNESR